MIYKDLFDILPNADVSYNWRDGSMRQKEKLLTPLLEEAGYEVRGEWYSPEYDSFGPLCRGVLCNFEGEAVIVSYG